MSNDLLVYGWGSHNVAQLKEPYKGLDPETFASLKRAYGLIQANHLPKPTDHRSLVFSPDGSEFLGTWGNSHKTDPTREILERKQQESHPGGTSRATI